MHKTGKHIIGIAKFVKPYANTVTAYFSTPLSLHLLLPGFSLPTKNGEQAPVLHCLQTDQNFADGQILMNSFFGICAEVTRCGNCFSKMPITINAKIEMKINRRKAACTFRGCY